MAVIPMEEHAAIDKLLVWYLVGFPLKHLTVVKHPGLALPPTLDAKTNLNETVSWHLEDHLSKRQNSGTYLTVVLSLCSLWVFCNMKLNRHHCCGRRLDCLKVLLFIF